MNQTVLPASCLYQNYTVLQSTAMITINLLSGVSSYSVIHQNLKNRLIFQGIIGLALILASTMYHTCQALCRQLYLTDMEWHRLDNVFAHTSFGILFYQIYGIDGDRRNILNILTLVLVIFAQQKYPWDLRFTIFPILFFALLALVFRKRNIDFNDNIKKGILWLLAALLLFWKGLNEHDDYLRGYHSAWHLFVGISANYFFAKDTFNKLQ